MEEVPNLQMRENEPPHESFESGRRYGLWQIEQAIKKLDSVKN